MESRFKVSLGEDVNGLSFNPESNEFDSVSGKVSGLFVDPHGRQFVQIKRKEGSAVNVDMFTVNAPSKDRQKYIDVIKAVTEAQKKGNERIESIQKEIVEESNAVINALYATLSPLIDLSFDGDDD